MQWTCGSILATSWEETEAAGQMKEEGGREEAKEGGRGGQYLRAVDVWLHFCYFLGREALQIVYSVEMGLLVEGLREGGKEGGKEGRRKGSMKGGMEGRRDGGTEGRKRDGGRRTSNRWTSSPSSEVATMSLPHLHGYAR